LRSCSSPREVEMPMNNVPMATIVRTSANVPNRARGCKANCPDDRINGPEQTGALGLAAAG
jgi:hypothetical protein